jgi:hypothetical protein
MPAVSSNVVLSVVNGLFAATGQTIFVQSAGVFIVISQSATTITVQNTGATGNATPTTNIGSNRQVSPSGVAGVLSSPLPIASGGSGQSSKSTAFNALSPLSTTGDILTFSGGSNVRVAAGTSGQILQYSGGLPTPTTPSFAASVITSGTLAIAQGGTNAATASAARTSLGVPALTGGNTFTGTNAFQVPAGGAFTVVGPTGTPSYFEVDLSDGTVSLNDTTGAQSVSGSDRILYGLWARPRTAYSLAANATFTVGVQDEYVVSTRSGTSAQTITLPVGTDGRTITISDGGGNASTNSITIQRSNTDTIVGANTFTISNNWGRVTLLYVLSSLTWVIV